MGSAWRRARGVGSSALVRRLIIAVLVLGPTLILVLVPSSSSGAPAIPPTADGGATPLPSRGPSDAGGDARAAKDSGPISKTPPDPTPLEDRRQWVVELRWDKGEVYLVAIRPLDVEAPRVTPRVMGRFALELFDRNVLIERARFDFPGLIDGDFADAGHLDPPRVDRKLTTSIGVLFPRSPRGTRFELWDRATDRRWPLPWPPPVAAPDAGTQSTRGS